MRDDVVTAIIAAIGTFDRDGFGQLLDQATGEEVHAATQRLRDAALRPAPDVLEFTLPQVSRLAAQGHALHWITEQLPAWRAWPDRTLADQLKIAEPERVAHIRDALRRCGLHVDQGATGQADDAGLSGESGS